MFGRIHQRSLGLGLFFVGRLLITDSISLHVIGLFRFSIHFLSLFCQFVFPISCRLYSLLVYNYLQHFKIILFISVKPVVISLLSFLIESSSLSLLHFSLVSLGKDLLILLVFPKNRLWFLRFSLLFLYSLLYTNLYYFLLSRSFWFICSF